MKLQCVQHACDLRDPNQFVIPHFRQDLLLYFDRNLFNGRCFLSELPPAIQECYQFDATGAMLSPTKFCMGFLAELCYYANRPILYFCSCEVVGLMRMFEAQRQLELSCKHVSVSPLGVWCAAWVEEYRVRWKRVLEGGGLHV